MFMSEPDWKRPKGIRARTHGHEDGFQPNTQVDFWQLSVKINLTSHKHHQFQIGHDYFPPIFYYGKKNILSLCAFFTYTYQLEDSGKNTKVHDFDFLKYPRPNYSKFADECR